MIGIKRENRSDARSKSINLSAGVSGKKCNCVFFLEETWKLLALLFACLDWIRRANNATLGLKQHIH